MSTPEQVLAFWLDEIGSRGWYAGGAALDQRILERFEPTWQVARDGGCALWPTSPRGTLAYIVLTDQFPRNMFRDSRQAFATDGRALAVAKAAISKGWDLRIDEPVRQFFYLPLMHSESITDQQRSVRLFLTRMCASGQDNLRHARAHRDVIRRFGRFPYRNTVLGRHMTPSEAQYLEQGGYRSTLQALMS